MLRPDDNVRIYPSLYVISTRGLLDIINPSDEIGTYTDRCRTKFDSFERVFDLE